MNSSVVRDEILTCAVEDYSLLYEVVAGLRDLYPEETTANIIKVARGEIARQLEIGWIKVFRTPSWTNQDQFVPLATEEAKRIVSRDDDYHYRPEQDPKQSCHWIGATLLGE
jgi:hypothetical protein